MPPAVHSPGSSSRKGGQGAILASAMVIGATWGYRKLIEPAAQPKPHESQARKIAGLEPQPASTAQFAVAAGFVFFALSVTNLAAPELASAFAVLFATGYLLTNGTAVFNDISAQLGQRQAQPQARRKGRR